MSRLWSRFPGLVLGAGLGALLPALALAWVARMNPSFIDDLPSLFLIGVLPVQALGAALGAWRAPSGRFALGLGLVAGVLASLLLGDSVAAARGPRRWRPALVVVALPGLPWEVVEASPMPTVLRIAASGTWAGFEPQVGIDGWITLDSGIDTQGRPWLGDRPTADQVAVARWWQVADWAGARPGLVGWPVSAPAIPLRSGPFVWPTALRTRPWPDDLAPAQALLDEALAPSDGSWGQLQAGWRAVRLGLRWSTVRDGVGWILRRRAHPEDSTLAADRPLLRARAARDLWGQLVAAERPPVLLLGLDGPASTRGGPAAEAGLNQADQLVAGLWDAVGPEVPFVVLSDQGWVVFSGGPAPRGASLGRIRAVDVAPTLLGLLDLGAARDMRGRALLGGPGAQVATFDALAPAPDPDPVRAEAARWALDAAASEAVAGPPRLDGW